MVPFVLQYFTKSNLGVFLNSDLWHSERVNSCSHNGDIHVGCIHFNSMKHVHACIILHYYKSACIFLILSPEKKDS